MRSLLVNARCIVVKVGSSLVTDDGRGLDRAAIAAWADQISRLTKQGKKVVLVSSGAVAEGMQRMGWSKRPTACTPCKPVFAGRCLKGVGNKEYTDGQAEGLCEHSVPAGLCNKT